MAPLKIFLGLSFGVTFLLNKYAGSWLPIDNLILAGFFLFGAQLLALIIWQCVVYPKFLSALRTIPGPSGGNLLMGHRLMMMKEPNGQIFRSWQEQIPNDGIIRYLDIFNSETIVPVSPKALAEVFVHKTYDFIKPPQLVAGLGKILGVGLFLAEGDEHKRQRKELAPAFAFRHIKDLYPIFWSKSRELMQALSSNVQSTHITSEATIEPIDVNDWASRATLDIIGVAGLGQDFESIKDPTNELICTYKKIFKPSRTGQLLGLLSFVLPRWLVSNLPIKRNDDIETASQVIKKTCYRLVQQAKQSLAKEETGTTDILSVAISSGGFSDEGLVNQLMTFLIAGHETSASALSWAICMLCSNPAVQTRLREEIRSSLPDPRSAQVNISAISIDNLPYLNAVCSETLRLYPPVPVTVRVAASDTSLVGHFIPKGTSIFISPWATNVNKDLWGDDALEFKPERWLSVDSKGVDNNYAFLTFLHGPRSCIGQGFAKGEIACLLAAWIGCFETRFEDEGFEIKVRNGLTPRPVDLKVRLKVVEEW